MEAADQGDSRLSFDRVAEIYDRVRPGYPSSLFDDLFDALPPSPEILEVGPGTGQATIGLLDRGAAVTAVELGARLAHFLGAKFADRQRLRVINASFESASLRPRYFDAVVSATAYHWIDAAAQIARPIELLRPAGVLAVIDLIQVASASDRGYFNRVQPIYASFGQGGHDWSLPTHDTAVPPIFEPLRDSGKYVSVDIRRARWDQIYTSSQYRDLLTSYSGTQSMAQPERDDMVNQLVSVIDDEFEGTLTRPLVATLTLARAPG